jgi:hypothetical protein
MRYFAIQQRTYFQGELLSHFAAGGPRCCLWITRPSSAKRSGRHVPSEVVDPHHPYTLPLLASHVPSLLRCKRWHLRLAEMM